MNIQHITTPNTCALLHDGTAITYVQAPPGADIYPGAGLDHFEQFATPEDALKRAKEINPAFDHQIIMGPDPVPDPVSDPNPSTPVASAAGQPDSHGSGEPGIKTAS